MNELAQPDRSARELDRLAQEVRDAGYLVAHTRRLVGRFVGGVAALAVFALGGAFFLSQGQGASMSFAAGLLCWLGLPLAGLFILAFPEMISAVPLHRADLRERLRVAVTGLPAERVAEILLPLEADRSRDTRHLAASLRKELRIAAEVTPVAPPGGQGWEASPS